MEKERKHIHTYPSYKAGDYGISKMHIQYVVWGSLCTCVISEVFCVFTQIMWFMVFIGELLAQFRVDQVTVKEKM